MAVTEDTRSSTRGMRICQKRGTLGHTGRLSVKNFSMKFLSIHSLVRKKIKTNRICISFRKKMKNGIVGCSVVLLMVDRKVKTFSDSI